MRFSAPLPALSAGLFLLSSCVPAPAPQPAPPVPIRPIPKPAPAPPPSVADWTDRPISPGTWSYRADTRGSIALFGPAGMDATFTIRCNKGANAVTLSRAGDARGTAFTIRTSTVTRVLPTQPSGGVPTYIAAVLGPDDRLLDAIGFSRGRFAVEAPPMGTLVIPAWAEILRVVEDCRS